jgi:hypothetical protein
VERGVWRGWRVEHTTALVFFAFMLMQKIYSPQYTLWLAAFALIANWETWTIAVLSLMGLTDYGNAIIHIALLQQHQPFVHWYEHHISPLAQGQRLLTTLVVSATMAHPTTMPTTPDRPTSASAPRELRSPEESQRPPIRTAGLCSFQ